MTTEAKYCSKHKATWLEALAIFFGADIVKHVWTDYHKKDRYIFYACRKCACGREEVRFLQARKIVWVEPGQIFKTEWERASFKAAEVIKKEIDK